MTKGLTALFAILALAALFFIGKFIYQQTIGKKLKTTLREDYQRHMLWMLPMISPTGWMIVIRCIRKVREDRYQSIDDILADVKGLSQSKKGAG